MKITEITNLKPRYEHDCGKCKFLGHFDYDKDYDLYLCQAKIKTYVVRWSDKDSCSGTNPDFYPFAVAEKLAVILGYTTYKQHYIYEYKHKIASVAFTHTKVNVIMPKIDFRMDIIMKLSKLNPKDTINLLYSQILYDSVIEKMTKVVYNRFYKYYELSDDLSMIFDNEYDSRNLFKSLDMHFNLDGKLMYHSNKIIDLNGSFEAIAKCIHDIIISS